MSDDEDEIHGKGKAMALRGQDDLQGKDEGHDSDLEAALRVAPLPASHQAIKKSAKVSKTSVQAK
eukprot:15333908-Alexandrium_andersonii.AAC.1